MAKPKTVEDLIKEGLIRRGNDPKLVCEWIPIGIAPLDELLGGGVPLGKCLELYGPESMGKTLITQYMAKAIQERPTRNRVLYFDLENSFDRVWWELSGVNVEELYHSSPATAEETIDVMVAMLVNSEDLGLIILDSIPGMIPAAQYDENRAAEEKTMALRAQLLTLLYSKLIPRLRVDNQISFVAINQMRDTMSGYDELNNLPGGKAQRHFSHIILRLRREGWILNSKSEREGFYMEIVSRKNKLAKTADGTTITLPFMYDSQIDFTTVIINDAIEKEIIRKKGPYYKLSNTEGEEQSLLGMQNLRLYLVSHPEVMEQVKVALSN